jgi:hypothetical protein
MVYHFISAISSIYYIIPSREHFIHRQVPVVLELVLLAPFLCVYEM